jgi:hypothetical protein
MEVDHALQNAHGIYISWPILLGRRQAAPVLRQQQDLSNAAFLSQHMCLSRIR